MTNLEKYINNKIDKCDIDISDEFIKNADSLDKIEMLTSVEEIFKINIEDCLLEQITNKKCVFKIIKDKIQNDNFC